MTQVVVKCPRCRQKTLRVWKHEHNRFMCSGSSCPRYEGECDNPKCEYPMPRGSRALAEKHGGVFWENGGYVSREAERIWSQKIEPLPKPFRGKLSDP